MLDQNLFNGCFNKKRIFITGHTGFKGSWLTKILIDLGAEIMGYALEPSEDKNIFSDLKLDNKINHRIGDIRDEENLFSNINIFQPEIVFHLAAQPLVRLSYEDPINTFSTNILGSANLLNSVAKIDCIKALVYITSDKCYENFGWNYGYRENDVLGGIDPYSASKAAAEIIFSSYLRSYYQQREGFGAASARAGNVIGGGDWSKDRIIPDCIKSIIENKPVFIRNPNATRPWQHVLEPLSGYLLLAQKLLEDPKKYSSSFNFGPSTNEEMSVDEVAKKLFFILEKGELKYDLQDNSKVHEASLLQLNYDKANKLLGWKPNWNVDNTIRHTADWYKAFLKNENMLEITQNQIYNFFGEQS